MKAAQRVQLVISYEVGAQSLFALHEAAHDLCDIIWLVDLQTEEMRQLAPLMNRMGSVVDTANRSRPQVIAELGAAGPAGLLSLHDTSTAALSEIGTALGLDFHSADVARGTALMVEQMVGREVPLGWCGGDPGGGLGTSVEAIMKAIDQAWSERGVAILVDLGGAETNSEMAIEMLPEARRDRVVVCNAPVVEGAVMAATEAASGATLEAVRRTAEELTPV